MELIGHRGCAAQHPENTVFAVTRTSQFLDAVEVDVRRCGSGQLVVFHDETVDEKTDGSGRVADLSWEELSRLDVLGSGEGIPLLSTVLDAVSDDVHLQIELKEKGLAADVHRTLEDTTGDVSISSFMPAALEEFNDTGSDLSTGFLFEHGPDDGIQTAVDLGCDAIHPHYDLCLQTDVVEDAHDEDMQVIAWKAARTRDEVEALRKVGVDGITADRYDIA